MKNSLLAVRSTYAVIKTVWLLLLDGTIEGTQYEISILRMDKRHCFTGYVNFSWLKTENAIEFVGPGYGLTSYFVVPTADVGQALSFGQLALVLLELVLGLLSI